MASRKKNRRSFTKRSSSVSTIVLTLIGYYDEREEIDWATAARGVGRKYAARREYAKLKNVMRRLEEEGYGHVANEVAKGMKSSRDVARDPRKKRTMKKSHPMAPYFAWVKKNHKKFAKPNGQLDMKRMWRHWKTHHA